MTDHIIADNLVDLITALKYYGILAEDIVMPTSPTVLVNLDFEELEKQRLFERMQEIYNGI